MTPPLLSFIVLSYNYQDYIGMTIQSILDQTVRDFEVIVVDDASTDQSCDVVRGFGDPRIRLLVNERNLGGAAAYNVAVNAASGTWLVNLDADDWIAAEKCTVQLAAVADDPGLDIVGSWVHIVDAAGAPHPQAETVESVINRDHHLNLVETWIGQNPLCRSSTMVRRSAHLAIGLDDPAMVRAPDYELWTRALAAGLRFGLVREPLTFYRIQTRGVTHADPAGTLRELGYAMARNLAPLAERRALFGAHDLMLRWLATDPRIDLLLPNEILRLLGTLLLLPELPDFATFRDSLAVPESDPMIERCGRVALVAACESVPVSVIEKLNSDIRAYCEARDYWKMQSEYWRENILAAKGVSRRRALWIATRMLHRAFLPSFRSS